MIRHIAIDAEHPHTTATYLSELLGGRAHHGFPFGDASTAFAQDGHGTLIECWPRGQPFHAAISVAHDDREVLDIARRAGWRAHVRPSGPFSVVEVWVDNRVMIEVLSPREAARYVQAVE